MNLVEIARYRYRWQAEMAREVLSEEGIASALIADDIGGMYAGIAPTRIQVVEADADRAREILAEIEEAGAEE